MSVYSSSFVHSLIPLKLDNNLKLSTSIATIFDVFSVYFFLKKKSRLWEHKTQFSLLAFINRNIGKRLAEKYFEIFFPFRMDQLD